MNFRVVVVGGGLSGLFTAVHLLEAGVDDLLVIERSDAPGGVARTIRREGYELEPAAGTLMLPHPSLSPLLAGLGVATEPAGGTGTRYVWTGDRLVPVPASPQALLAPVLPWPAKLRALAEVAVRSRNAGDESLDEFMARRFGPGAGRELAWLAASGVFAGDPARLSAAAAFPALPALEEAAGSVIRGGLRRRRAAPARPAARVPAGGMSAVADAAAARLGERLLPGWEVEAVRREGGRWLVAGAEQLSAEHLVLACRPAAAARLVGGELGEVLGRAVAAPVVVLGLGGRGQVPDGFGALTARHAGLATRGVLFESSYAPHRAPPGRSLVKAIAGGATRPEVAGWDADRLLEEVGGEAARIAGLGPGWEFAEVVRHPEGIPQYEVGHGDWLAELARLLEDQPGLALTGWGYRGVGVAAVAADAAAVAARIAGTGAG